MGQECRRESKLRDAAWDHWCDEDDETMTRLKQKMPTEFDAQRMMREGREEGLPNEIDIDSKQTLTDIFRGSPAEPGEMFLSFFWTIFCTVQAVLWIGVAIRARARMGLDDGKLLLLSFLSFAWRGTRCLFVAHLTFPAQSSAMTHEGPIQTSTPFSATRPCSASISVELQTS